MAKIIIEIDKETKEIKMKIDNLNPVEVISIFSTCIQNALSRISLGEKEEDKKILTPITARLPKELQPKNLRILKGGK